MTVDDIFDALYLQAKDVVGLSKLRDIVLTDESINRLQFNRKGQEPIEFVKVVWCKDCKYSTPLTLYDKGVKGLFCNYRGSIGDWRYRTTDDFCSRGERKDEVEE